MKQKGFAPLLIILITVVLISTAAGGYLIYKQKASTASSPQKSAATSPSPLSSLSPSPSVNGTRNWETFKDVKYGFEIKYPEPPNSYKNQFPTQQYLKADQNAGYRLILSRNTLKREDSLIVIQKVGLNISTLEYWKSEQMKSNLSLTCTQIECIGSYPNSDKKFHFQISEGQIDGKKTTIINDPDSNYGNDSFALYSKIIILRLNDQYMMQINMGASPVTNTMLSTLKFIP